MEQTGPIVPAAQHLFLRPDGLPAALAVAYDKGDYAVAVYNWESAPGDIAIAWPTLRLPGNTNYTHKLVSIGKEPVTLKNGVLTITAQPGKACVP